MSKKRFIVESVMITKDCNEDKSRIVKVITDKEELYSYDDLYEIKDLLNEKQDCINKLMRFIVLHNLDEECKECLKNE